MSMFGIITSPLRRWGFGNKRTFSRSAVRYNCKIDGKLMYMERMTTIEGRLLDFSSGGAMFRPRLAYLMYRRDDPVVLMFGDQELFGKIVSTTPGGFGIRFEAPLDEDEVAALLALNGDDQDKLH